MENRRAYLVFMGGLFIFLLAKTEMVLSNFLGDLTVLNYKVFSSQGGFASSYIPNLHHQVLWPVFEKSI